MEIVCKWMFYDVSSHSDTEQMYQVKKIKLSGAMWTFKLNSVWAAITTQLHHNSNKMWALMGIHSERLRASMTNAVAWIQAAHIDQIDNWEAGKAVFFVCFVLHTAACL